MNVFITGATGFIGSHLANFLKKENKVVMLIRDRILDKWLKEVQKGCIKVQGDVSDFRFLKRVINQYEIDAVYHLAAIAVVSHVLKNPIETFDTNIMGAVNVLEACRQHDVAKILIQSTDKVYGEGLNQTILSPLKPVEPYGTSKMCEDLIAQSFMNAYGMNIIISRPCNAYGYDRNSRIVPNTIRACLHGEKPIIWKWENTLRQYIYVEDLVDALVYLTTKFDSGIFNIATPDILSPEQVVQTILKFFPHLEPKYLEREKPTEIRQQSMKMEAFGWGPKYSFKEGIKETIRRFEKYGF